MLTVLLASLTGMVSSAVTLHGLSTVLGPTGIAHYAPLGGTETEENDD